LTVTQQGTAITLPCSVPATLSATGQSGSTFTCLFPRTFTATRAHAFVATATADNVIILGGSQTSVTVTTALCSDSDEIVVPNLVDRLDPSANGDNKTVGQAKSMWTAAGFSASNLTTQPSSAASSLDTITQNRTAYTCDEDDQSIRIGAR
jgi:hypothetical protein